MTDRPSEPSDETQPHDTASWRAADANAAPPAGVASYSPTPEPRTDWARSRWADAEPTPERWFEGSPGVAPVRPVRTASRRGPGAGTVLAAALAAAVLSSGGTVVALNAAGAFNRSTPAVAASQNANSATVKQPVTL